MVTRTYYMPVALDARAAALARQLGVSKGELVRQAIELLLGDMDMWERAAVAAKQG